MSRKNDAYLQSWREDSRAGTTGSFLLAFRFVAAFTTDMTNLLSKSHLIQIEPEKILDSTQKQVYVSKMSVIKFSK